MSETIVKGRMEDHLGRQFHPMSEAALIAMANGKSVETAVAELLAMFAEYLPLSGGGTVNGKINITNGRLDVNQWATISAGTDGFMMLGQNCYKGPTDNAYYFRNTHSDLGARAIVFRYGGNSGISWFDTGMIATTADQEFTPTFRSLTNPEGELITGQDLNNLTANGFFCGSTLTNAPFASSDWWYVINRHLTDNATAYITQTAIAVNQNAIYTRTRRNNQWQPWERIATVSGDGNASFIPIPRYGPDSWRGGYVGFPDANHTLYLTNDVSGGAINLSAPGGVQINGTRIPTQYVSTQAPDNAQGVDGDTWDVYV